MTAPTRITPDVLLWAHQLKRENIQLHERLKKLETLTSRTQKSTSSIDASVLNALNARISDLERASAGKQLQESSITAVEDRIESLEARLGKLDQKHEVHEFALTDVKDLKWALTSKGGPFKLLDKEVDDQAEDIESLKTSSKAIQSGIALLASKIHNLGTTDRDVNHRLAAIDKTLQGLEKATEDSFDGLLDTDRMASALADKVRSVETALSKLLPEMKYHLAQIYGQFERLDTQVETQSSQVLSAGYHTSMNTQDEPPEDCETHPNLENRWDNEFGEDVPVMSQDQISLTSSLQQHEQGKDLPALYPRVDVSQTQRPPLQDHSGSEDVLAHTKRSSQGGRHIVANPRISQLRGVFARNPSQQETFPSYQEPRQRPHLTDTRIDARVNNIREGNLASRRELLRTDYRGYSAYNSAISPMREQPQKSFGHQYLTRPQLTTKRKMTSDDVHHPFSTIEEVSTNDLPVQMKQLEGIEEVSKSDLPVQRRGEEDIKTQTPTPTPPRVSKKGAIKGKNLVRESQRLQEPTFMFNDGENSLLRTPSRQTRSQVRAGSLQPASRQARRVSIQHKPQVKRSEGPPIKRRK